MTQYWNPEWKTDTMAEYVSGGPIDAPGALMVTLPTWKLHTVLDTYMWVGQIHNVLCRQPGVPLFLECKGGKYVNVDHIVAFEPVV